MKNAFKEAMEDIGFGMVLPGDNRLLATLNLAGAMASGFFGLISRNPTLLALSAFGLVCAAAEYKIHGSNIRRGLEASEAVANAKMAP